ncbi:MAG TPA: aspartate/glutamate racemase family protein, partial [Gemmatimonadales bacterium]|nr:aspartate/glutamate racemase family protein [Gemmatimonadales bacterium]
ERACPLLVPLVEEGWFDHPATRLIASQYLDELVREGIDTLVLGCTHYPLLRPLLAELLGDGVVLIDSARETAAELAATLQAQGIAASPGSRRPSRWAATDDVARFAAVGGRFADEAIATAELVQLVEGQLVR